MLQRFYFDKIIEHKQPSVLKVGNKLKFLNSCHLLFAGQSTRITRGVNKYSNIFRNNFFFRYDNVCIYLPNVEIFSKHMFLIKITKEKEDLLFYCFYLNDTNLFQLSTSIYCYFLCRCSSFCSTFFNFLDNIGTADNFSKYDVF